MSRIPALALTIILLAWSSKANLVDTCTYLNGFDLAGALNSELSISALPDTSGQISQCLCVSGISSFINDNPLAAVAVSKTSMSDVLDAFAGIIDSTPGHQNCNYPDNSVASCTQNDICHYRCKQGFSYRRKQCVCLPPKHNCNGECSHSACPSDVARKRNVNSQTTLGRFCPLGQEACGGYSGPNSYECIDTRTTLDSCGGCVFPIQGHEEGGTDCSVIPGVENVRCTNGQCSVMSCKLGWHVAADGQSCTTF